MVLWQPSAEVFRNQAIDSASILAHSTSSTFSLGHLTLTCPLEHQPGIIRLRIGHHILGEAEVDHITDVGDGQRALRNVGAEDHLTLLQWEWFKDRLKFLPWDR